MEGIAVNPATIMESKWAIPAELDNKPMPHWFIPAMWFLLSQQHTGSNAKE